MGGQLSRLSEQALSRQRCQSHALPSNIRRESGESVVLVSDWEENGLADLLSQQTVTYLPVSDAIYNVKHGGSADSTDILQVLADEYARKILLAADHGPKTAKTLSEECNASLTTIYRRVSTLQDHGLIEEHHTVDSDGSHRSKFETALEELHVDITDGQLSLTVETHDELADNFTSLWSDLRGDD